MKTLKIMIVSLLLVTQSYALSHSGKKALLGIGAIAVLAYALQANSNHNYERGDKKVIYIDSHKRDIKRHIRKHRKHNHYNRDYYRDNACNSHGYKHHRKHNHKYNNYYSGNNKRYIRKDYHHEVVINRSHRDYRYRY